MLRCANGDSPPGRPLFAKTSTVPWFEAPLGCHGSSKCLVNTKHETNDGRFGSTDGVSNTATVGGGGEVRGPRGTTRYRVCGEKRCVSRRWRLCTLEKSMHADLCSEIRKSIGGNIRRLGNRCFSGSDWLHPHLFSPMTGTPVRLLPPLDGR